MSVTERLRFLDALELQLTDMQAMIAGQHHQGDPKRVSAFLQSVGLQYLTLSRGAATLSGGEAQRIRLATQIGSCAHGRALHPR